LTKNVETEPEIKAGDVIFISGAAGAVGNVAGQLAKLRGGKVIGSAGSMEKVLFLRNECGFERGFQWSGRSGSIWVMFITGRRCKTSVRYS
jgi:NADPH-dependent curcumin reductase CurA